MTTRTPYGSIDTLIERMSLEQKIAQLVSFWDSQPGDSVAPMAAEMASESPFDAATAHGIGHLTRVYGTIPVDPSERAAWLETAQQNIRERSGHGIGALVHEECLTGVAAWQATTYPSPIAWGATFNPELIRDMGKRIGEDLASLGVHQGLAPVLDVLADPRWGRTEEVIGEDPYLVGTIGTAYVEGLQEAGVDATLKHFVGYAASKAARNHAPVQIGPRDLAEIYLPPFEMAIIEGGAKSVMNSYTQIDGIPVAAHPDLFNELLREQWGFDGVVVSDYFAVAFLHLTHKVASDNREAGKAALKSGIDVELPNGDSYLELIAAVREGDFPEEYVDIALRRVLEQKQRHGLLEVSESTTPERIDLDPPKNRALARKIAEESVILLSNDGVLPLSGSERKIALVGPNARSGSALMGCYSFVNHVLAHHPGIQDGIELPTVAESLQHALTSVQLEVVEGCAIDSEDVSGIAEAVEVASQSDVAILVLGDRAGLFGRGTVGEGNDAESLELPGKQRDLAEAVIATGTPTVLVLLTGRPYAIEWALDGPHRAAAVVQAFFPGEEGGPALADIIVGTVNPSGHLPVSIPRNAGAQPYSYLHPFLGGANEVTRLDPTPSRPFGFGLSYSTFEYTELNVPTEVSNGDAVHVSVSVKNTSDRAGSTVVQLYGADLYASIAPSLANLLAYARVQLDAGEEKTLEFQLPPARFSLVNKDLQRVVEPGEFEIWAGSSCEDKAITRRLHVVGDVYHVGLHDHRRAQVIHK